MTIIKVSFFKTNRAMIHYAGGRNELVLGDREPTLYNTLRQKYAPTSRRENHTFPTQDESLTPSQRDKIGR